MKVDSRLIVQLFEEVKYLLDGIDQIFREGEYVEEGINSIAENVKTMFSAFTIDHMTPATLSRKKEHSFLYDQVKLVDKTEAGLGLTPEENITLFKARFYLTLKKQIAKQDLPINCHQGEIENFIENEVVPNTTYESYFFTDFQSTMYNVIKLISREIVEHRKKHPQISMSFDNPTDKPKSKNLIDIL